MNLNVLGHTLIYPAKVMVGWVVNRRRPNREPYLTDLDRQVAQAQISPTLIVRAHPHWRMGQATFTFKDGTSAKQMNDLIRWINNLTQQVGAPAREAIVGAWQALYNGELAAKFNISIVDHGRTGSERRHNALQLRQPDEEKMDGQSRENRALGFWLAFLFHQDVRDNFKDAGISLKNTGNTGLLLDGMQQYFESQGKRANCHSLPVDREYFGDCSINLIVPQETDRELVNICFNGADGRPIDVKRILASATAVSNDVSEIVGAQREPKRIN